MAPLSLIRPRLARHGCLCLRPRPTTPNSQHFLDLFRSVILGSPEDKTLGNAIATQFVNLDHLAERD